MIVWCRVAIMLACLVSLACTTDPLRPVDSQVQVRSEHGAWLDFAGAKVDAISPGTIYFRQLERTSAKISVRMLDGRCEFPSEVRVAFGADSVGTFDCEIGSTFLLEVDGESAQLTVAAEARTDAGIDAGASDGGPPMPLCQISKLNFGQTIDAGVAEPSTATAMRLSVFVESGSDCVISLRVKEPASGNFYFESTTTTQSSGVESRTRSLSVGGLAEFRLLFAPDAYDQNYGAEALLAIDDVIVEELALVGRSTISCPRRDAGCPVAEIGTTYLSTASALYELSDSGIATKLVDFLDVFDRPMSVKDIGLLGDGTLLAVGGLGNALFLVDPQTGRGRLISAFSQSCNGLDTLSDGGVLIGGSLELFHFNLLSGHQTVLGVFPTSGDVVSDGVAVFATSPSSTGTELILRLNLASGVVDVLSDTGFRDGWGLTLVGQDLTMFTGLGQVVGVSMTSGAVLSSRTLPGLWTGAARKE